MRGYTYGTRQGDSFWSTRTELALRRRKISVVSPVVFVDLGWAGDTDDWPAGGASGDILWSAGAGASFLNGIFRTDLIFRESSTVWLELYFAGSL